MSYTDLIFTLPNLSSMGVVSLFFLILLRIAPIVAFAPFLGGKIAPIPAKMGLAIVLTILFFPMIAPVTDGAIGFTRIFIGYAIKELFIGITLGFFISIPFYAVQSSGILVDYLRGASIMQSQDRSLQNQASPIGVLYNYMLIVIFFSIHGPFLFFDGVIQSYQLVPPNHYLNPLFFKINNPLWQIAFDLINRIVTIAIQLSAPPLIAVLMAEMFLGIANRLAPQVQIAFLGMSIKSFLGLMLLWAAWQFILKQFALYSYSWLQIIDKIVQTFRYLIPNTR